MRRWLSSALTLLLFSSVAAADPVTLVEADSQAFLQHSGAMDVIYTLTFVDNEGRTQIKKVGQFYEPIHFTRSLLYSGAQGGEPQPAKLTSLGGGFYSVDFETPTRAGQTYRLELHFRSNRRFADPTSLGAKQLLVVSYNPVRWTLPVQKSVIKLVLPLALPTAVQRHEAITPAMVDQLGVVTNAANLKRQDRWAFVYTDYHDQRRLTLYAERRDLPREAVHLVLLYIPREAMPALAAGQDIEASGGAIAEMLTARGSATLVAERYDLYGHLAGGIRAQAR